MNKFLLVEDSPLVAKIIRHIVNTDTDLTFDLATSFAEANEKWQNADQYIAAVVDLNLPDAPNGEIVDASLKHNIPTIVLTGSFDEHKRDQMLEKPIVDYIIKESRFSYEYVLKLIRRLDKNRHIRVLVADDSATSRRYISNMLKTHLYQVIEANDGEQALEIINKDPLIKLLITDYNMPNMNGFDLVKQIRRSVDKNNLVIIGLSTYGSGSLSAKFIKNGANDFLSKPFSHEEFHCRILHNIETMEHVERINHAANHDHLTNLPNRRFFYSKGNELLEKCRHSGTPFSLALLDIDYFKKINDNHGHEAGDIALQKMATLLTEAFSRFFVARMGGEEFCILLPGLSQDKAYTLLDNFRQLIEDNIIILDDDSLTFTISAGVCEYAGEPSSLDELLNTADRRLYNAKLNGRNQVCIHDI